MAMKMKTEVCNGVFMKGIYKITNTETGMSYIGKTEKDFNRRFRQHLNALKAQRHPNKYLQHSYNKYGSDKFSFEIIEAFEPDEDVNLNELEQYYIELYDTYNNGYNLTKGGEGTLGFYLSEETRRKLSEAKKGYIPWNKGKSGIYTPSEETRRKVSKTNKGVFVGEEHSQATITEKQAHEICKLLEKGLSVSKIAKILGVKESVVHHIRFGNSWTHISKNYNFPSPRKELERLKNEVYTPEYVYEVYKRVGNKKKVAAQLGVSPSFVRQRLQEYEQIINKLEVMSYV